MADILVVGDDPELRYAVREAAAVLGGEVSVREARTVTMAFERLHAGPVDLLVSTLVPEESTGPEWLHAVRARWPHVPRIVAPREADPDKLEAAYRIARHVLPLPAETGELTWALGSALDGARAVEGTEALAQAQGYVDRLVNPPCSLAHFNALHAALEPQSPLRHEIRTAIEASPLLTLRVLRLANSTFYGSGHPVATVPGALARLGPELLRGVLLSLRVLDERDVEAHVAADMRVLKSHARLLGRILRRLRAGQPDEALGYTAGLLHDIGRLGVLLLEPALVRQVDRHSLELGQVRHDVEVDICGVRHADIGATWLAQSGVPAPLVELVRGHALPSVAGPEAPPALLGPLHVAHARLEAAGLGGGGTPHGLDLGFLERHGFEGYLPAWDAVIAEELAADRASAAA